MQQKQLWQKMCKTSSATLPYIEQISGFEWDQEKMLGYAVAKQVEEIAWKEVEKEAADDQKERRKAAAEKLGINLTKGGAIAFKALRNVTGGKKRTAHLPKLSQEKTAQ